MAANELLSLLEYIEQERGIGRDDLVDALEKSLVSAGRKSIDYGKNLIVHVNKHTGKITASVDFDVVDGSTEGEVININEAIKTNPDVKIGDTITREIPHKDFGRIAAQTAKQTMIQQLRKAEKARVYEDFKESLGQIISGTVRRFESGNIIVDFQRAEGILAYRDKSPNDNFFVGDRINALLLDINTSGAGPSLVINRSSRNFLRRLFEQEITEISEGIVEIKGIARDPGVRSKVAVTSNEARVDPIGACIGLRGSRVKSITTELGGERIDIIRYDENRKNYILNAMQPATPKSVEVDEKNGVINVYVDKSQIRLAIGKNWQNAKLCGQLLGMKINVVPFDNEESVFEKKLKEAVKILAENLTISEDLTKKLVDNGILSIDGLKAAEKKDLLAIEGFTEDTVNNILESLEKL
ncbi:MAG: transcription termination factor NusA [bacterium]|nr:transcription termination factor NusA [bacterium]